MSDTNGGIRPALYSVPLERPMVSADTADAMRAELAAYEAREARLLGEISNLHQALGYIRASCETALVYCMLPNSLQARVLEEAIAKTWEPLR